MAWFNRPLPGVKIAIFTDESTEIQKYWATCSQSLGKEATELDAGQSFSLTPDALCQHLLPPCCIPLAVFSPSSPAQGSKLLRDRGCVSFTIVPHGHHTLWHDAGIKRLTGMIQFSCNPQKKHWTLSPKARIQVLPLSTLVVSAWVDLSSLPHLQQWI